MGSKTNNFNILGDYRGVKELGFGCMVFGFYFVGCKEFLEILSRCYMILVIFRERLVGW